MNSLPREAIIDAPPKGLQIIMWSGQSNAAGTVPRPEGNLLGPPRTFMLTLGGKWVTPAFDPSQTTETSLGGSLYPGFYPPNQRRGSGAAIYFLNKWVELNPATDVALVNVACGGSKLEHHLPSQPIYHAGRTQLARAKRYGKIAAFVWIQGETDAMTNEMAGRWSDNFVTLVGAWRSEHGAAPVVVAQLGDPVWPGKLPYWTLVKQQQEEAVTRLSNATLVRTGGLKKEIVMGSESLHYTDESFRTLGESIALALYALKDRNAARD